MQVPFAGGLLIVFCSSNILGVHQRSQLYCERSITVDWGAFGRVLKLPVKKPKGLQASLSILWKARVSGTEVIPLLSNITAKSTYSCLSTVAMCCSHPDLQDGFKHSTVDPLEVRCLPIFHEMHRLYWAAFTEVNFVVQYLAQKHIEDT